MAEFKAKTIQFTAARSVPAKTPELRLCCTTWLGTVKKHQQVQTGRTAVLLRLLNPLHVHKPGSGLITRCSAAQSHYANQKP